MNRRFRSMFTDKLYVRTTYNWPRNFNNPKMGLFLLHQALQPRTERSERRSERAYRFLKAAKRCLRKLLQHRSKQVCNTKGSERSVRIVVRASVPCRPWPTCSTSVSALLKLEIHCSRQASGTVWPSCVHPPWVDSCAACRPHPDRSSHTFLYVFGHVKLR